MFRRRARDREFREAQRVGMALLAMHAQMPWPEDPGLASSTCPSAPETAAAAEFLPPELRVPSRDEVDGRMMRWLQPLVIDDNVQECPQCGSYRDWIILSMRDDTVWLRCRAGHQTKEPRLDAAWYNRNSGPYDVFHATFEEGLRHLGH
ncbi:hypothetical protein P8605_00770 [Streptomyces sp. T-3]|nr:hypothetical protein [Streptomyces sp. T-3]